MFLEDILFQFFYQHPDFRKELDATGLDKFHVMDKEVPADYGAFLEKARLRLRELGDNELDHQEAKEKAITKEEQKKAKVSEDHLVTMRALAADLCHPTIDFFGTLITLLGGEVSGHTLTTILNCFVNLFYQMYCYGKCPYDVMEFYEYTTGVVLGDDHVIGVSEERDLFSHTHITSILQGVGIGYTMADLS